MNNSMRPAIFLWILPLLFIGCGEEIFKATFEDRKPPMSLLVSAGSSASLTSTDSSMSLLSKSQIMEQTIQGRRGWNSLSFYVNPGAADLKDFFGDDNFVRAYTLINNQLQEPKRIVPGIGYFIELRFDKDYVALGEPMNRLDYDLHPGESFIGILPPPFDVQIDPKAQVHQIKTWSPEKEQFIDATTLEKGNAYIINIDSSTSLSLKRPSQLSTDFVCPDNYLSNFSKIRWPDTVASFQSLDIFDASWKLIHQGAVQGPSVNQFSPATLDLAEGLYHWKIRSPESGNPSHVSCNQGQFIVPKIEPITDDQAHYANPSIFADSTENYLFGLSASLVEQNENLLVGSTYQHISTHRKFPLDIDISEYRKKYPDGQTPMQIWNFWLTRNPDGTLHLYAGIHLGNFAVVIGHLRPANSETSLPIRKWVLDSIVLGDPSVPNQPGHYPPAPVNYYDVSLFWENGNSYIYYVHTDHQRGQANAIYMRPMLSPTEVGGPERRVLRATDFNSEHPWETLENVEGPSVIKVRDKYVLSYSTGHWANETYRLGIAYANSPLGPFEKLVIPDPENTWHNPYPYDVLYLLQSSHPNWPNYVGKYLHGPGIGNIVPLDGRYHLVFHAYSKSEVRLPNGDYNADRRMVFKMPLELDMGANKPQDEWIRWGY